MSSFHNHDDLNVLLRQAMCAAKNTTGSTEPVSKHYILYHRGCSDGIGAAWAAWIALGDKAEYIPVLYGEPVPEIEDGSIVYLVDFSYPLKIIMDLKSRGVIVRIIDHHKSAYEDFVRDTVIAHLNKNCCFGNKEHSKDSLATKLLVKLVMFFPGLREEITEDLGIENPIFDMSKSGAVLSWEYFHPDIPLPRVLKYVQDRDLWLFKEENTKAALEGMRASGQIYDFEFWTKMTESVNLDDCIRSGRNIIKYQQNVIKETVDDPKKYAIVELYGYIAAVYNTSTLMSDMAEAFYSKDMLFDINNPSDPVKVDFTLSYDIRGDGTVQFSLRSKSGSKVDVSQIAKAISPKGGGHKHAAGARLEAAQGLQFLQNIYNSQQFLEEN